ncbi:hypothetical protein LTR08_002579 [Meristemomyces frigidus]|nr:hypothetical protein LTR08_002579 [Meristemomyces frigidus]
MLTPTLFRPLIYPALLNIYLAPTSHTIAVGTTRVATLVFFALITLIYAPAVYLEAAAPAWVIPVAIAGSSLPFLAAVALGTLVTSIRLHLPDDARKSKDHLLSFASRPPASTKLRVQFIRWAPWLTSKDIALQDLRRLQTSSYRLPNLEDIGAQQTHTPQSPSASYGPTLLWRLLVQRSMNRYFVSADARRRGNGGGAEVWETLRLKIPFYGEAVAARTKAEGEGSGGERKAVVMRNRASGVGPAQAVLAKGKFPPKPAAAAAAFGKKGKS